MTAAFGWPFFFCPLVRRRIALSTPVRDYQQLKVEVSRAKPKKKPYRLADGGGLYLWVPLSGVKVWQFRYRHGGKPQTATLGKFSDAQGLAWARTKADEA